MIKVNKLLINKRTFQLGPIDLELEEGYVYAITGNSGSGKTLFLQTLLGGLSLEKNMKERVPLPMNIWGKLLMIKKKIYIKRQNKIGHITNMIL